MLVIAGAREEQLRRESKSKHDSSQAHETLDYPEAIDDRVFYTILGQLLLEVWGAAVVLDKAAVSTVLPAHYWNLNRISTTKRSMSAK